MGKELKEWNFLGPSKVLWDKADTPEILVLKRSK